MKETFVLDIGTRVVVGLIMEREEDGYRIVASSRSEHAERAMYEGQVHDVDEVARAVSRVKADIERQVGREMRKVAIAAAGRTLKTKIAQAERREIAPIRWEQEDVLALELEAVARALKEIEGQENDAASYHCVGYNTVEHWLEDQKIANLVGQRGKTAKTVVIATFLPRTVVDGLLAVLDRVGLEMESLTLEPIAAGLAAIPPNMRRMNLALVDIGAGTSDIAITKNGSFYAYGMIPRAGDAVTEAICNSFFVDFPTGEKIKKQMHLDKPKLSFKNFFGEKVSIAKEDVLEVIKPVTAELCEKIAKEIMRLNTSLPQGVIMVGGGSLTPGLADMLAEVLGLPRARVGIQVCERIVKLIGDHRLKGPDNVTVVGIGMSAIERKGLNYYTVKVNGSSIPIFELQLTTVAEALLAAGIQPRSFIGRPGAAITFELNGEMQIVKGQLGEPAKLTVNGQTARLDQEVRPNDNIEFLPGRDGEDARVFVRDVIPETSIPKEIVFNDELIRFKPVVKINGREANEDDPIEDGSKVDLIDNRTLSDLLAQKGIKPHVELRLTVNDKEYVCKAGIVVLVNGMECSGDYVLKNGDRVTCSQRVPRIADLAVEPEPLTFWVNGKQITYPVKKKRVICRGEELAPETEIVDGMVLRVEGYECMPILSDLLPHIPEINDAPPGSRLSLKVNGQDAQFTTPLHPGAQIELKWITL